MAGGDGAGVRGAGLDGSGSVTESFGSANDHEVRHSSAEAVVRERDADASRSDAVGPARDLDAPRSGADVAGPARDLDMSRSGVDAVGSAREFDMSRSAAGSVDLAHELDATEPAKPGPLLRLVQRQEVAFAAVGGFNTALGIGLTIVWLAVLGDNVPPSVAVAAAYAVSIVIAFVLHRTLVFRVRGHLVRDFVRFVAVNSGGLLLNMALLELAVSVWHFPDKPAAVVVMALVAVASYFGHRHISFRRRPPVEPDHVVG
ncbi:GtrA family protein [Nocardia sp. NPDC056564]|uniref:GtrA family protein n=1 Tax=Nocardia sp. NPDC056564 TaxID=3345865 RepID=UPI00366AD4C7